MDQNLLLRAPRISHRELNINIESTQTGNFLFESVNDNFDLVDSDDENDFSFSTLMSNRPQAEVYSDLFKIDESWISKIETKQNVKKIGQQSFLIYEALINMNNFNAYQSIR